MLRNHTSNFYSGLLLLAFLFAFAVILLGAYTRLTNAGLSCPDWPRCYGYLTPPSSSLELASANQAYPQVPVDQAKAWAEMRHRYLAGFEGLLILSLVALSWLKRKSLSRSTFILSQSLVLIMIGQILLGMLTVTALLKPVVVLGHLLLGFSLMSLLWVLWLSNKSSQQKLTPSSAKPWLNLGLVLLFLQITLGGWVSTHYAGLACIDFPYCNGVVLPTLHFKAFNTDLITIHMLHRIGALVTFLYLSFLGSYLVVEKSQRRLGLLLLFLLGAQIILGVLNLLWLRPLSIALPHHAIAALLLLTLLALRVGVRNHD